ncbi:MAG: OmpA family protein [Phormidesmis sp.]
MADESRPNRTHTQDSTNPESDLFAYPLPGPTPPVPPPPSTAPPADNGINLEFHYPSRRGTVGEIGRPPAREFDRDVAHEFGAPLDRPLVPTPRIWQKQPYVAIAHLLAMSGTLVAGWLFGILIAQLIPGDIKTPPLQESLLRKTSRLSSRLWHFNQLWRTPTAEVRIEAVPIPSTAPVAKSIALTPIERQPLIDELNSIETEILTLDRRVQALEKRLGSPSYEGADIDTRVNTLRNAIDPPIRPEIEPTYKPTPVGPSGTLLEVARLKMTLPSDALFEPGQSSLKDDALLSQVLDQLVNYPESTVLIRSYSDDRADAIAARDYTLAQANAIATYLQAALPTAHRWVTIGSGQAQPVTANDTPPERQRNRRIEILVDTR